MIVAVRPVVAGLVPAIHAEPRPVTWNNDQALLPLDGVDARDKRGHDGPESVG